MSMKRILLLSLLAVVLLSGNLRAESSEEGDQSAVEAVQENAADAEDELDAEDAAVEKKKKETDDEKPAGTTVEPEGLQPTPPTGIGTVEQAQPTEPRTGTTPVKPDGLKPKPPTGIGTVEQGQPTEPRTGTTPVKPDGLKPKPPTGIGTVEQAQPTEPKTGTSPVEPDGLKPKPPTGIGTVEQPLDPNETGTAAGSDAGPAAPEAPAPVESDATSDTQLAGTDVSQTAEEKEEAAKWWSISLSYQFAHNLAKERPSLSNSFAVDPGFIIPGEVRIGLHLGVSGSLDYGRSTSTYPGGSNDYRDTKDLKNFQTWDMDPLAISVGRKIWGYKFSDEASFSSGASLVLILPFTSEYGGRVPGWNFAYKPGLKAGFSLGDFGINDKVTFQQNFHNGDFSLYDMGGAVYIPHVQFKLSNSLSLSWSKWGVSASAFFSVIRSWKYTYDLDPIDAQDQGIDYVEGRIITMGYGWEIGYSFAKLEVPVLETMSIAAGMTTNGPERFNGGFGSDRLYPLDPMYTQVYVTLSSSF